MYVYMCTEADAHLQVCAHKHRISPKRWLKMLMSTNMRHHMRTNAMRMDPSIHAFIEVYATRSSQKKDSVDVR